MRNPHTAIIGTMIGAALLVLIASLACGREDHERIAEDVAREWAMTEADGISEEDREQIANDVAREWATTEAEGISEEKEYHERIAEDVAREWTMTKADGISEEIAAMATRRYGSSVVLKITCDSTSSVLCVATLGKEAYEESIPTAADSGQIRETIRWEFGPPTRKSDGRYEVIATASVSFDIAPSKSSDILREMPDLVPDLGTTHSGSVDYKLEVDTTAREVSNAKMPLASVRISRIL